MRVDLVYGSAGMYTFKREQEMVWYLIHTKNGSCKDIKMKDQVFQKMRWKVNQVSTTLQEREVIIV